MMGGSGQSGNPNAAGGQLGQMANPQTKDPMQNLNRQGAPNFKGPAQQPAQQPWSFNQNYDPSKPTGAGNWRRLPNQPAQSPDQFKPQPMVDPYRRGPDQLKPEPRQIDPETMRRWEQENRIRRQPSPPNPNRRWVQGDPNGTNSAPSGYWEDSTGGGQKPGSQYGGYGSMPMPWSGPTQGPMRDPEAHLKPMPGNLGGFSAMGDGGQGQKPGQYYAQNMRGTLGNSQMGQLLGQFANPNTSIQPAGRAGGK